MNVDLWLLFVFREVGSRVGSSETITPFGYHHLLTTLHQRIPLVIVLLLTLVIHHWLILIDKLPHADHWLFPSQYAPCVNGTASYVPGALYCGIPRFRECLIIPTPAIRCITRNLGFIAGVGHVGVN